MPRSALLLLLLLAFFNTKGQQNIDSLENLLKSSQNTGRIDILNKLGYALASVDSKKSVAYVIEALKLSEKENYIKGIASAHWTFGDIYCMSAEYPKAIEHTI